MDFNFIIKKSVQDICDEVKKDENMDLLKNDILNPIVEHVILQMYPYDPLNLPPPLHLLHYLILLLYLFL